MRGLPSSGARPSGVARSRWPRRPSPGPSELCFFCLRCLCVASRLALFRPLSRADRGPMLSIQQRDNRRAILSDCRGDAMGPARSSQAASSERASGAARSAAQRALRIAALCAACCAVRCCFVAQAPSLLIALGSRPMHCTHGSHRTWQAFDPGVHASPLDEQRPAAAGGGLASQQAQRPRPSHHLTITNHHHHHNNPYTSQTGTSPTASPTPTTCASLTRRCATASSPLARR